MTMLCIVLGQPLLLGLLHAHTTIGLDLLASIGGIVSCLFLVGACSGFCSLNLAHRLPTVLGRFAGGQRVASRVCTTTSRQLLASGEKVLASCCFLPIQLNPPCECDLVISVTRSLAACSKPAKGTNLAYETAAKDLQTGVKCDKQRRKQFALQCSSRLQKLISRLDRTEDKTAEHLYSPGILGNQTRR